MRHSEQISEDGDFRELEYDIGAMPDYLGADLDQLLAQRSQPHVLNLLRQCERPKEVAEVMSECMKLKSDRMVAEAGMFKGNNSRCRLNSSLKIYATTKQI